MSEEKENEQTEEIETLTFEELRKIELQEKYIRKKIKKIALSDIQEIRGVDVKQMEKIDNLFNELMQKKREIESRLKLENNNKVLGDKGKSVVNKGKKKVK